MTTQPPTGWHQDPADPTRQRWWDASAQQWLDNTRPAQAGFAGPPPPPKKSRAGWIVAGVIVAALAVMWGVGAATDDEKDDSPAAPAATTTKGPTGFDAQAACRGAVQDRLRDPDSSKFRGERVIPMNNGWIVLGQVNAKNAYGGMAGFTSFRCEATVVGGVVRASATIAEP